MKAIPAILLVVCCAPALTAQVVIRTILNNGNSSNRYDIVILGDGYQSTEQAKFDANCKAVIDTLFVTEPYKTFKPFFNVHTVFRASKDSGADHPDRNPPIVKDTVYDASYNIGGTPRCLYIKNQGQALRDAALAPAVEGRVMVVVNDSRYGGCAGTFAVTYNGTSMTAVQVHEFGHSFAGLADEYDYPNSTYTGSEPGQRNVTKDPTGKAKWPKWLGYNGVAAFEGARYYRYGLYRPKVNCIMRTLGQPMCPVCAEQAVVSSYRTVSAIENPLPANTTVAVDQGVPQKFSFTLFPATTPAPSIVWKVDGAVQSSTTTALTVDTSKLGYGTNHAVVAEVHNSSPFVREDPQAVLTSKRTWTLSINRPSLPDLYALYLPPSQGGAAGSNIAIDSWVQNVGVVASPAVQVDHFLSSDTTFDAKDTYLGSFTQGALNPNQAVLNHRAVVAIPAHVVPGTYFIGMVIDRADAVKELNENNNVTWFQIPISKATCDGRLSYDDPLTYPASATEVQSGVGGIVQPVVTAPCNVGDGYLILFGCSGTTPGTPLAPNLNLPLNVDACTRVFYGGLGSPLLAGFFGRIDAGGHGRARLTVPTSVTGVINGHFAAVIFDPTTTGFKRVTEAVSFTFK